MLRMILYRSCLIYHIGLIEPSLALRKDTGNHDCPALMLCQIDLMGCCQLIGYLCRSSNAG